MQNDLTSIDDQLHGRILNYSSKINLGKKLLKKLLALYYEELANEKDNELKEELKSNYKDYLNIKPEFKQIKELP